MYPTVKRCLDIAIALVALILLFPVLVVLGIAVKLDSPGPALFPSRRLGKHGVPFTMYKFRSMRHNSPRLANADGSCAGLKNDPRLTRLGRVLREFSIDELPQLWNVLKGEMSLIGPRPDEVVEAVHYDDLLRAKLRVRPGITNLPAVSGRNSLSWHERATLDNFYIDHLSFWLDFKILIRTPLAVVSREGIYTSASQLTSAAEGSRR